MFIEVLLAILIGSFLGIITGITPGVHINLVAAILLTLTPLLTQHFSILFIAAIIVSMSIVHTFLDAIPTTFLGAPDESNILSAFPSHVLLLQGKGFEAVKLASIGSFLGLVLVTLSLPLIIVAVPFIFNTLQNYIGYILLGVVLFMILREQGMKKFWAFFIFSIAGILGILVFSLNIKQPLFPMLSGLFGIATLISSLLEKVNIPEQIISNDLEVTKKDLTKSLLAGTFSGSLVSIFPGMGPAQAAILGTQLVGKIKDHIYIVLIGVIGTVSMALSLITLFTIDKARNGSIIVVQKLLGQIDFKLFLMLIFIALVAGAIGVLLSLWFARIFSSLISKINYRMLCISVIAFVSLLVFLFTGWLGIFILAVATSIGLIPGFVNVGRNHAMGVLLLPVILYFLL
jgi:putative membrane protein